MRRSVWERLGGGDKIFFAPCADTRLRHPRIYSGYPFRYLSNKWGRQWNGPLKHVFWPRVTTDCRRAKKECLDVMGKIKLVTVQSNGNIKYLSVVDLLNKIKCLE